MSDRELLELAAKAAGIVLFRWYDLAADCDECNAKLGPGFYLGDEFGPFWNPLTDDGDALRLAVKLDLDISSDRRAGLVAVAGEDCVAHENIAPDGWDQLDATRRAIVRASAEIGKSLDNDSSLDKKHNI